MALVQIAGKVTIRNRTEVQLKLLACLWECTWSKRDHCSLKRIKQFQQSNKRMNPLRWAVLHQGSMDVDTI